MPAEQAGTAEPTGPADAAESAGHGPPAAGPASTDSAEADDGTGSRPAAGPEIVGPEAAADGNGHEPAVGPASISPAEDVDGSEHRPAAGLESIGSVGESDGPPSGTSGTDPADGAEQATSPVDAAFAAPVGTEWNRVSPMLAWYRRLILLGVLVPVAALGAGALWMWSWVLAVAWVVLAVGVGAAGWPAASTVWRSWGYAEGRTDFYLTYGVVIRQLVVIPYGRMQVVDVTSNLLEQALGMATVRVRTAATTADTRIPGLRLDDAVVLRDRLATRSETFSTGL
ncbi:PH domain-containing protein [Nocardiopsis sediminis]|uniref:PH domain-containing protein n=1 Tax=Nocardiopsis sediminis TaxID=1778267 RepID=UPI00366B2FF7